jgi:tetratricopeptide (TPR) repeat protein
MTHDLPCPRGGRSLRPVLLPRPFLVSALFLLAPTASAAGQDHDHLAAADTMEASVHAPALFPNLGRFHRTIRGSDGRGVDPAAEAYFNQGMRLTFGFGHGEAVDSFRHARDLDPDCALCWWGEAWALGPYINRPSIPPEMEVEARRAIDEALRRVDGASPEERALIEAMATRYRPDPDREAGRAREDSLYAEAMADVVRRFPHDLDAAMLYAEAMMVLSPWDLWEEDGSPKPGTTEAVAALQSVLGRDLAHPGACHLYVHAIEASLEPERAAPCATLLEDAIPGVSHVAHMPAHIFMRIGRYGDAVRGNLKAWHADQQAAFGGPQGVYPSHNLHMLAFAASFDGQSAIAMQAARDLARVSAGSDFYRHVTLVRFGRWDEILEDHAIPETSLRQGVWHFARGMAHARTGALAEAEAELEALREMRTEAGEGRFRGHAQADLLGMAEGTLAGEMLAAGGDWEGAIAALRDGAALEDGLAYDEPEPWFIPVRHVLGAVLLEAGRPAEAEAVYREQLQAHPENGWSLFGLARALRDQGRELEAEEVDARFDRAWARSDTWLRGSRY